MTNQPYKDNIILVTGGAGYIGAQLIRDLVQDPAFAGCVIRVYDNLHRQHFCGLMDLPTNGHYEFIEGDILDRLNLMRALQGVSTVVHLAALVRTPLSFDHPEWTNQINHWGTASVIDCALSTGVERFIYASSASVYGPGGPFQETATCRPVGPYAISKLKGEQEVLRGGERGLHFTIARLATAYGNAPAMRFDATANQLAYLAGIKKPLVIHGSGAQIRPLIHIRDVSAALGFCLTHTSTKNQILNVVTSNPTINEIAHTLQTLVPTACVRYTDQDMLTEISFEVDATKLLSLGFQPRFNLRQGLETMLSRWQGYQPALSQDQDLRAALDDMV